MLARLQQRYMENLKTAAGGLFLLLASVAGGLGVVAYVTLVEGNLMLISALPFVLAMMILLVVDKRMLLLLILMFRASGDVVFEMSKFGGGFGVGALINALIIFIAMLFVLERPGGITRRVASIWGPVLLVACVALAYAPEFRDGLRMLLALTSYCAVFVIAFYVVRSRADFELCVTTILLSSLIPVLYAFVDIAQNINTFSADGFRLQSTFSHPNIFAFYIVLCISLLFYRLKTRLVQASAATRWTFVAYMLLLLGLLVMTKTRSAWAACFVIFAVYGLLFERKYLFYLLLALVAALLIPSVRDRLLDLGSGNEYVRNAQLNSFAWRLFLWESAIEWMSKAKSLFGYGLNSFKHYSPVFFPLAGNTHFGAHSTYVQWFFETGVVGIMTAIWMYARLFFTLKLGSQQDKLRTVIAITLVIEYLFFAFSDNMLDYLAFNWYFWFFMGAACAMTMVQQRAEQEEAAMTQRLVAQQRASNTSSFFKSNRRHEPRF
jgi:O-antigen ligase